MEEIREIGHHGRMFEAADRDEAAKRAAGRAARAEALTDLAELLATMLPMHASWQTTYTFESAVKAARVERFWRGGEAVPSIEHLLQRVMEEERGRFGHMMETVLEQAIFHRERTRMPLARTELDELNGLLEALGFELSRLRAPAFRHGLVDLLGDEAARETRARALLERSREEFETLVRRRTPVEAAPGLAALLRRLLRMCQVHPSTRFAARDDWARGAFPLGFLRITLAATTRPPLAAAELERFEQGLEAGALGLLISANGFLPETVHAAAMRTAPTFMMMDGAHVYRVLLGELEFVPLCERLVAAVAREANPYVPVEALVALAG